VLSASAPTRLPAQSDTFAASGGDIVFTSFAGASVQIEYRGTVVHVDPWSRVSYASSSPADLILVTDTPADHLDPELIARLRTPTTVVIVPSTPGDARDDGGAVRLRAVEGAVVMNNGERRDFIAPRSSATEVVVEAVAMYDLIPGEPFHARGEGNGYVLTLGGVRVYVAGVTECTPEMRAVEDVDVLFVPMNLPNGRMPPAAAADCARHLAPDVVYPYHYRERPIDAFVDALRDSAIEVRVRDWYPPA
jgi:L-ascorbate metabolism protein UlaG (beta-lactamase superfamily)